MRGLLADGWPTTTGGASSCGIRAQPGSGKRTGDGHWDILRKHDKTVYATPGCAIREAQRAYADGLYDSLKPHEELATGGKNGIGRDYSALKFDPSEIANRDIYNQELELAVDRIAAIREPIREDSVSNIEGHEWLTSGEAARFCKRNKPFNPRWH